MKKAFVSIHGFGMHPGGMKHGFSSALRDNVQDLLGYEVVWEEVLWNDLLPSPDSKSPLDLMLQTSREVKRFFKGLHGRAIRMRIAETVRAAAEKAGGAPVVLIGHSFGGVIAYDIMARQQAPEARALVMLAPPMGLFHHPEEFLRNAAGHCGREEQIAALGLDKISATISSFPHVRGGRLPEDLPALSIRSESDWFAVSLAPEFHDVSEIDVKPPRGTRESSLHSFYWKSPEVARSVAAKAVEAATDAGIPPATSIEMELQCQAVMESLYAPPRMIYSKDGSICGCEIS